MRNSRRSSRETPSSRCTARGTARRRTGYKIIRLRFSDGKPTGVYEDFVTGFVIDDSKVWGRPVDVTQAPDGALLFTEDGNGTLWRVSYAGK